MIMQDPFKQSMLCYDIGKDTLPENGTENYKNCGKLVNGSDEQLLKLNQLSKKVT